MPPEAPAALEVSGLSHRFGTRRALDQVGFSVRAGDFAVLLGLNGAGKTTLFSLITRLYSAQSGRIAVYGFDTEKSPLQALARLGAVFQQATLDLDITAEENLFYHAALHGMTRVAARQRMDEELERVGLAARRRERVRNLSGGMRRRLELARALLHRPSLLLLDEPTVGLDMESRQFLIGHVRSLCSGSGLGVLWATHLIDEAADDARVIVLHEGRVLADDTALGVAGGGDGGLPAAFERLTRRRAA